MEKNNYRLVGIINIFGIYPAFVYPIFEKDGKYYLQHSEVNVIDCFVETSKNKRLSMVHYSEINPNLNIKNIFTIGDEPIFAFQVDKNNVFISEIDDFIEFINIFQTDDHVLSEQISEFIDEVKLRKALTKKKAKEESNKIKS